ncbi:choline BCCT transporter BetT, partial [Corynebacterium bovis]|uniref:choline BCCT transporter BetT n=1 Tax=Corynebacterium bovis TaxID=36808 RepID=UPI0035DE69C2
GASPATRPPGDDPHPRSGTPDGGGERRPRAILGTYAAGRPTSPHPTTPAPNWPVITVTLAVTLGLALWATLAPDSAGAGLAAVTGWITGSLGWFYILTVALVLLFMIWVACSRSGRVRLGPDHSRPQFSLFSWSAMLFAAGIGIAILFYSVAEPVTQFMHPPVGPGQDADAARDAVVFTLFHYGMSGWALYALLGLAFGYFAYRRNMPLAIRSALYPVLERRIHGPVGDAVDVAAMLGTVFGVAASLGIGVVQLNYGLSELLGIGEGVTWQIALVVLAVAVATVSAVSGVDKGIKRLSEINVYLALLLLAFVLVTGRTGFLLDSLVTNIGDYLVSLPRWTVETYSYAGSFDGLGSSDPAATREWMSQWTLFFWAWWVAWAPFVGLFLARISRGRTLRQFIVGTLVVPFFFVAVWAAVFGNTALDRVVRGDSDFTATTVAHPERGFYMLLEGMPWPTVTIVLATAIGLLFFVTSADSGALVMANFSSQVTDPRQDGAVWMRVLWSVVVAVLTVTMLQVGGIPTLQSATIVMGLPFAVVIYLIMYGLWSSLRREAVREDSRALAAHAVISGRTGTAPGAGEAWRDRLRRADTWPDADDVARYVRDVAGPALRSVAAALEERGHAVTLASTPVEGTPVPQLDLFIPFGDGVEFRYGLYPVEHDLPAFLHRTGRYTRLEVTGVNGSLGYDVAGYSREQLIGNVLDLYDRHREFLHLDRDAPGGAVGVADGGEVPDWSADFAPDGD